VWGEAAGDNEQVIREREIDAIFAFGLRGWLMGCSDVYSIEVAAFELLREL
jgi:hypothetical protein